MRVVLAFLVACTSGIAVGAEESGPAITALAIAPDGGVITGGQAGISDDRIPAELSQVHDLVFSPDGMWLVAAGGAPAESGGVEFHSLEQNKPPRRHPELAADVIYSAAWSPDGLRVAVGSLDGTCLLLHAADGAVERTIRGHSRGVTAVAFLTDELLATASLDHTIRIWSVGRGELKRTLKNHTAPITGLALRPDGESSLPMLVSISPDRTVRLWQPTIGRMVRFVRLDSVPLSVTWTRDGRRLLAGCRDGNVRVIDPDTIQITHRLKGIPSHAWCLATLPQGQEIVLAGADGETARLRLPSGD